MKTKTKNIYFEKKNIMMRISKMILVNLIKYQNEKPWRG